MSKTKAMVFRKRGGLKRGETWLYNGYPVEVVNNFNYLGVIFNYTGNYTLNQEHLMGKGLKAMNILLANCRKYKLKPKILCQLFDAFIGSTLSYACEIWGFTKSKELERLHLRFCKQILGVNMRTSNVGVYGELGRYPLYIGRYVRIIKYWSKIVRTDNIIISVIYKQALSDCDNGYSNWASNVKKMLYEFGCGYVWEAQTTFDLKSFHIEFKRRLVDNFIQNWNTDVANNRVMYLYVNFKDSFAYEHYLDALPYDLRFYMSRLRLASHSLRVQTGRFGVNRLERNLRLCLICNTVDIEDEYHFILVCKTLSEIRKKYIKKYYYTRPSVYKFIALLQNTNKKVLTNLAKFIREAFIFRTSVTNTLN